MRAEQKRDLARALRRNATDAEHIMWRLLRDRRLGAVKFRRQVPIGPYIADFASIAHRLVVELDGGQHSENAADVRRDAFLKAEGWRVLRFWNNDVMHNRAGVLWSIGQALGSIGTRDALTLRMPSPAVAPGDLRVALSGERERAIAMRGARGAARPNPRGPRPEHDEVALASSTPALLRYDELPPITAQQKQIGEERS